MSCAVILLCSCAFVMSRLYGVWHAARNDPSDCSRGKADSLRARRKAPLKSAVPQRHIAIGVVDRVSSGMPEAERKCLSGKIAETLSYAERAQTASDKNQVMDALLNLPDMPADYGRRMVELYRDKEQDVVTRDFAVQHIGLYAEAMNRRNVYQADSGESRMFRATLDDAASNTKTIIAAAAFRALADMEAFDPHVDSRSLDARLVACAADTLASHAARVMAIQLCGERRVVSARAVLAAIAADDGAPETLRRSSRHALSLLDVNF